MQRFFDIRSKSIAWDNFGSGVFVDILLPEMVIRVMWVRK